MIESAALGGCYLCSALLDDFFPETSDLSVFWACQGTPTHLILSFPTQDCENYITLLERRGNRLLVCGTNARKPSCWNLVRTLPMCLSSPHFLGGRQPLIARQR